MFVYAQNQKKRIKVKIFFTHGFGKKHQKIKNAQEFEDEFDQDQKLHGYKFD